MKKQRDTKINQTKYIPQLKNAGFSDYEISFWINNSNYPTGVWQNLNNRINNAIRR